MSQQHWKLDQLLAFSPKISILDRQMKLGQTELSALVDLRLLLVHIFFDLRPQLVRLSFESALG